MNWYPSHPTWRALLQAFVQESSPIYMVGGVVRDRLLGKQDSFADLDLVATHAAIPTARRVADRLGWSFYPLDEGRDVARLIFAHNTGDPLVCDVARMRGDTIEADLLARDFTVNAMAVALSQQAAPQLIDICNGAQDLQQKLIRRVSLASLADDSVRLLRAVRLSLQLGFTIEAETRSQIERLSSTIVIASPERLRDELWKCLAGNQPSASIQEMHNLGLLRHMLPEISSMIGVEQSAPHALDVYQHTLWVVEYARQVRDWLKGQQSTANDQRSTINNQQSTINNQLSTLNATFAMLKPYLFHLRDHFLKPVAAQRLRVDWLVWLALFHDIGKPVTRTAEVQVDGSTRYRFFDHDLRGAEMSVRRLERLHFSRAEIDLAEAVIKAHMRPHLLHESFHTPTGQQPISRRARYRFFRDLGGRQLDSPTGVDVLLLALADRLALDRREPYAVGAVSIPHGLGSIENLDGVTNVPGTLWVGNHTYAEETLSPKWHGYLAHIEELLHFAYSDAQAAFARQQPLVDGYLLMNHFSLSPGPHLGALLEKVQEAQATGEINTTEAALLYVAQLLKS